MADTHGHAHGEKGAHAPSAAPRNVLRLALVLTAGFMLVEAAVGWWSGSLALLADAGHMLADVAALSLALVAQHWSLRPHDERSTYGYRRAEVLAAFVNGIALSLTAVFIIREAVERFVTPVPIRGMGMLVTAVAGLLVNVLVAALLMRTEKENINVRAALAHVLADALGSAGAILAAVLVLGFGLYAADPALSILIALLVLYSGWRVLKSATGILLEAVPSHIDMAQVQQAILACPGVAEAHDLHVWRISDRFDVVTVHVVLTRGSHGTDVCRAVAERLRHDFGLSHVTVQPEAPPPDEVVSLRAGRHGAKIERTG